MTAFFSQVRNGNGKLIKRECKLCHKTYGASTGNGTLVKHIRSKHASYAARLVSKRPPQLGDAAAAASSSESEVDMTAPVSAAAAAAPPSHALVRSDSARTVASSAAAAAGASDGGSKRKAEDSLLEFAKKPRQLCITQMFSKNTDAELYQYIAYAFAENSIPHRVIETGSFRDMLMAVRNSSKPPPPRDVLRATIIKVAADIRIWLKCKLGSSTIPATIGVDGWTNVNHAKVLNILPISAGVAYFWGSIVNADSSSTAEWLSEQLIPRLQQLIDQSIRFVAFVADNESTMGALFRLLQIPFPFLIRVPCCAHTIQLVVKNVLKRQAEKKCLAVVADIIQSFEKSKEKRLRLRALQLESGSHYYPLVKPNDTRWSSTLATIDRLIKLRQPIQFILPQPESFWNELQELSVFLLPFKLATDVVQRDSATLFDVWKQFTVLLKHVKASKRGAVPAVLTQWDKHVNIPATIGCAILSFEAPQQFSMFQQVQARQCMVDFGSEYIFFYRLAAGTKADVRARLLVQVAQFMGRAGPFSNLDEEVDQMKAQQLLDNSTQSKDGKTISWWDPKLTWHFHLASSPELALTAIALLSVTASEAAVERTFSAQDAIHTKKRNLLKDDIVEAELFVKFNRRALNRTFIQHGVVVELNADAADEVGEPAAAFHDSEPEFESEVEEDAEQEESKHDPESASVPEDPIPIPSTGARTEEERLDIRLTFIRKYIMINNVVRGYRWGPDQCAKLMTTALNWDPPVDENQVDLIAAIKAEVKNPTQMDLNVAGSSLGL